MQFTSIIATAILSTAVLAAPTKRAAAKSMAAADNAEWTFEGVTRQCSDDGSSCDWSFGINANDGNAATPCTFTVTGDPAYKAPETGASCGAYTITSGWSNQFGDDKAFTTVSVVNGQLIAYPAYTDAELASGQPVSPDRSYPVQSIPQ